MGDLEFRLFRVSSSFGDWLAVFEGTELIFLGSYALGKKALSETLNDFFFKNYDFHLGNFTPLKWTKGNFWKTQHRLKLQGTELQVKVWRELLNIPRGTTCTYSDIAKRIRKPKAVRAVASALGANPICYWIPCHRVVGKSPGAALKYYWGSKLKEQLLTHEGALYKQ